MSSKGFFQIDIPSHTDVPPHLAQQHLSRSEEWKVVPDKEVSVSTTVGGAKHKKRSWLAKLEEKQLEKYFTIILRCCRYQVQYTNVLQKLLATVEFNAYLKPVVEAVVRDVGLLDFKKTLPENKPENDPITGLSPYTLPESPCPAIGVHQPFLQNTSTTPAPLQGTTPQNGIYWCGNVVCVVLGGTLGSWFVQTEMQEPDSSKFIWHSNGKEVVVCTGGRGVFFVLNTIKRNLIRAFFLCESDHIITAVHMMSCGDVCLGTSGGLYYRMDLTTGKIVTFDKHRYGLTFFGLYSSGSKKVIGHTITDVCLLEDDMNSEQITIEIQRAVCAKVSGGIIVVHDPYDNIRIYSAHGKPSENIIHSPTTQSTPNMWRPYDSLTLAPDMSHIVLECLDGTTKTLTLKK
jgi:hypothetical protein